MTEIFFSVENSYNVNFPEGGGGGRGIPISSDGDDRIRVKIKTPQKSLGLPANSPPPPKNPQGFHQPPPPPPKKKFPGTKLTRKKIHVEFPSLKNLQKI